MGKLTVVQGAQRLLTDRSLLDPRLDQFRVSGVLQRAMCAADHMDSAGQVIKSTSFYTQKVRSRPSFYQQPSSSYSSTQLFSLNKGDEYLPSTLPSPTGTLFWSVTRNTSSSSVIVKVSACSSYAFFRILIARM